MYHGDRSRKEALVEYGFRLPSAFDNRPLTFDEFTAAAWARRVYVSATPGALRAASSAGEARGRAGHPADRAHGSRASPCGRPATRWTTSWTRSARAPSATSGCWSPRSPSAWPRTSPSTTSRSGLRVRYLHSDIDTLERVDVIRDLRLGKFDALIGINLLREGLDLPEVSLVAILDADKEGYLRSATSLIQTSGRAARNVNGEVIMYADQMTDSMARPRSARPSGGAIRRPPTTPSTGSRRSRSAARSASCCRRSTSATTTRSRWRRPPRRFESPAALAERVKRVEAEMKEAAKRLDFEQAAELRDRVRALRKRDLSARG